MVGAQLAAGLRLLEGTGAVLVNVGHGRDAVSVAVAEEFVRAWGDRGGEVGAVVGWPSAAASWLRPARRLAAGRPDAWIVADGPEGWARMGERLLRDTEWDPGRTIVFAAPALVDGATFELTEGLRGVSRDGGRWAVVDGAVREW